MSHPELARHGAFSADKVYSLADLTEIVELAANLSIRVVPSPSNKYRDRIYKTIELTGVYPTILKFSELGPDMYLTEQVPEVDVPAHTASWRHGAPDAVANCDWLVPLDPSQVDNPFKKLDLVSLDPSRVETGALVREVLSEVPSP